MQPRLIGELVNASVPVLVGIYLTLQGYRVVGKKQGKSASYDSWFNRYGTWSKQFGPLLIVTGLLIGVFGVRREISSSVSGNLFTQLSWIRYQTSDGVCSIEFPGKPKQDTKTEMGVTNDRITFAPSGEDAYYTLTFSDTAEFGNVTNVEARLDVMRDTLPTLAAAKGMTYTLIRESRLTENGVAGRDLEFNSNGTHIMRLKLFLVHGRAYRAIVVLPIRENNNEVMKHFLDSFRFEPSTT